MTVTLERLESLLEQVKGDVVAWRRHFHQYPELSFEEENTSQFVYDNTANLRRVRTVTPDENQRDGSLNRTASREDAGDSRRHGRFANHGGKHVRIHLPESRGDARLRA